MKAQGIKTAVGENLVVGGRLLALALLFLLVPLVLAANDPGHDTLYVLRLGDTNVTGTINISGNLTATLVEATGRFFGPNLDIVGNGSTSGAQNWLRATTTDLEISSGSSVILNPGSGRPVHVGSASTPANFNVSGTIFQNSVRVCLQNGTHCPSNLTGSNISSSSTSTDNAIVRFDGTTGRVIQNSVVTIDDSGNVNGIGNITAKTVFFIGNGASAAGADAFAIGTGAAVSGAESIAQGYFSFAPGAHSVAIGSSASTYSDDAVALGYVAWAYGTNSTAIGAFARTNHNRSIALGAYATTTAANQLVIGNRSTFTQINTQQYGTIDAYGVMINGTTVCTATNGLCAVGSANNISGVGTTGTIAVWGNASHLNNSILSQSGNTLTINGNVSMPNNFYIGNGAWTSGAGSIAIGTTTNATADSAVAIGELAKANRTASFALGAGSIASGDAAIAVGYLAAATNTYAQSIGYASSASGANDVAVGHSAAASGGSATAIGEGAIASGAGGIAIGTAATSAHTASIAIGATATTTAANQLMLGNLTYPLNTIVHGTLNTTGNLYEGVNRVCTAANGLCVNGGGLDTTSGGWRNSSTTVFLNNNNTNVSVDTTTLYVDTANNRVGIGTPIPSQLLHVNSSSTDGTQVVIQNTDTGGAAWRIISTASGSTGGAGNLGFYDGSNYRLYLNSTTGYVGVGTTSPSGQFHVAGNSLNTYFTSNAAATTGYSRVFINNDADTGPAIISYGSAFAGTSTYGGLAYANLSTITGYGNRGLVISTNGDIPLVLGTSDEERIRITATGNVGINTTTPGQTLEVVGTINATQLCIGTDCRSSWPTGGLDGTSSGWRNSTTTVFLNSNATNISAGYLSSTPIFYVDNANGRVGINTSSPSAPLHIIGQGYSTVGGLIRLDANAASTVGATIAMNSTLTSGKLFQIISTGSGAATGAGALAIYDATAGAYRWRIDTNGNMLLNGNIAGGFGDSRISINQTNGQNDAALTMAYGPSQPVFSILPWQGTTYLSSGVYYSDGNWIKHGDTSYAHLFGMQPNAGTIWYSTNVSESTVSNWNLASGITLWNTQGNWTSSISSTRSGPSYITGGLVGINTTTPASTFEVDGRIRVIGSTTPATGGGLEIGYSSPNAVLLAYNRTSSMYHNIRFNGANFSFENNGVEGARFTNGSLGIGVYAPDAKLAVNGSQSTSFSGDPMRVYENVAAYSNNNGPVVGTMIISMPKYWSNTMFSVKITGYEYNTNYGPWEATVGAYNYGGAPQYLSYSGSIEGTAPFTSIRLASNTTHNLILLGTTTTTWNYPKAVVSEVIVGYTNYQAWGEGWGMRINASESGVTNITTPSMSSPFRSNPGLLTYTASNIGDWNIASGTNNSAYPYAALEVREYNLGGAMSSQASEAPRISFHWGGLVASQIGMAADGTIRTYDNPGTGFQAFAAGTTTMYNSGNGCVLQVNAANSAATPGCPWIRSDGNYLVINPDSTGPIYMNWDTGHGVYFGNGGNVGVLKIGGVDNVSTPGFPWMRSNGDYLVINPDTGSPIYMAWDAGSAVNFGAVINAGTGTATYANAIGDIYATDDIEYDGDLYGPGTDLAELINVSNSSGIVEVGAVVVADESAAERVKLSTMPYDTTVIGIISSDPGITLGKNVGDAPLALSGRVPIKVSAENGPIKPGDLLTTSSTPGHAMRCENREACQGSLVAKSLGTLEEGTGLITGLVVLG